ncbi:hypothetical protein TWF730_007961 [Orbilia blumenaviensis]|uniref:F-box domain-containing protein n=1 Tax=Orbilia blumenaviensis TaxID=1796055 RepID=A0AAV9VC99_9PEZI
MSLVSLPPELVDLIFAEGLKTPDLGKVRLLSKDYNARFKAQFWYRVFNPVRIYLTTKSIERLITTSAQSEALPYMQHVIISRSQSAHEEPKNPQIVQLLAKAFSALTHLKTVEINILRGTDAIDYWKPIINAIIESGKTTIEVIKGPHAAIQMSKFKTITTAKLLGNYRTAFCNLRSLEIRTSVQLESPAATAHFWSLIAAMGSKLEDLTVGNTRMSFREDPKPGPSKTYQPKLFALPELKRLKLDGVAISAKDLKALLQNSAGVEAIDITNCRMPNESVDWFEFLTYLKDHRFPKLRQLNLAMSACYKGTSYELPKLRVDGDWVMEDCIVTLPSGKTDDYLFRKNLWNELEAHHDMDGFWDSLTDLKWTSKQATRPKRRRIIEDEWMLEMRAFGDPERYEDGDSEVEWVNNKYEQQLDLLDAEADD